MRTGRAKKSVQVNESLRTVGTRRSDQSEVWRDISEKADRLQARSDTEAAAAMYDTHRSSLEEYLQAFRTVDGQCGAMFAINGQILRLDIFDSPMTLPKTFPKLAESFALDAIDSEIVEKDVSSEDATSFLDEASNAKVEQFQAVGVGEDNRLQGDRLSGGALVDNGRVMHLCAFRVPNRSEEEQEARGRMLRASQRRRSRA